MGVITSPVLVFLHMWEMDSCAHVVSVSQSLVWLLHAVEIDLNKVSSFPQFLVLIPAFRPTHKAEMYNTKTVLSDCSVFSCIMVVHEKQLCAVVAKILSTM